MDQYLKDSMVYFNRGGKAESALGRLDEVHLVFDTRGYPEIKRHLQARRAEIEKSGRGRYHFSYLDELAAPPKTVEETRAGLNALISKYHGKGLQKIIEGVTYSRYVGLLLELKTVEHYLDLGYTILQSGRELFDSEGLYITELDTVVRSPEGKVLLVEAKSARVPLNSEEVLRDKVARKLAVYSRHRAQLEAAVGYPIDEIVFSMDVGRNEELVPFLEGRRKVLGGKYGFSISFLFLESAPAKDAHPAR